MDIHSGLKLRFLRLRASWGQLSLSKKATLSLMVLALLVFPSAYILSMNGINLYGRAEEPSTPPSPPDRELYYTSEEPSTSYHIFNVGEVATASSILRLRETREAVKNQSNFAYEWEVTDPSIVSIQPYVNCTNGIQEPCPLDHVTITGLREGRTSVTVKIMWKPIRDQIGFSDIGVYVGNPTNSPTPTYALTPTYVPTPTPVCHTGVKQLKVRVQCGNSKYRYGSVICWDNSRFEIGSNTGCYTSDQIKAWANNKCANRRYCEPAPTLPPFPTVTPTPRIPTPAPTRTPTPSPTKVPTPTPTFAPF